MTNSAVSPFTGQTISELNEDIIAASPFESNDKEVILSNIWYQSVLSYIQGYFKSNPNIRVWHDQDIRAQDKVRRVLLTHPNLTLLQRYQGPDTYDTCSIYESGDYLIIKFYSVDWVVKVIS